MILFLIFFLFVFVLPKFWLSNAMKKNDEELMNMPFTAEEFGQIILKENNLLKDTYFSYQAYSNIDEDYETHFKNLNITNPITEKYFENIIRFFICFF